MVKENFFIFHEMPTSSKNKLGVGIIVDYSRDYTVVVVNGV